MEWLGWGTECKRNGCGEFKGYQFRNFLRVDEKGPLCEEEKNEYLDRHVGLNPFARHMNRRERR